MPIYNVSLASIIAFASYVLWVASVPPTPPASKTETKHQLSWLRFHAKINAIMFCTFMMLTAYRALAGGQNVDALILKNICPRSTLQTPLELPLIVVTGYSLLLFGAYVRIKSQRLLGEYFTWEISLKEGQRLYTTGPYSVVRHPGYLGLWCVRVGFDIIQSNHGSVLSDCLYLRHPALVTLFIWKNYFITLQIFVWMFFRMNWEDDMLEKEFGAEWKIYREQTPYRIIPFIY